jgi:large subunit ribosomal protein L25
MEQIELEVFLRAGKGKEAARRIRREGKIPAVLYGRRMETFHLSLKPEDLKKILTRGARENTLIGLKVSGTESDQVGKPVVMLKDLQIHPISQSYLHADFYAVAMDEKVEVEVPIRLAGKPEGIKTGGILAQALRELRIRCLPSNIPEFVEVDVRGLNIGDSTHVRDIPPSEKYEVLTDPDIPLASVAPPISEAKYEEIVTAPEGEREVVQPERVGEKEEGAEPEEAKEKK